LSLSLLLLTDLGVWRHANSYDKEATVSVPFKAVIYGDLYRRLIESDSRYIPAPGLPFAEQYPVGAPVVWISGGDLFASVGTVTAVDAAARTVAVDLTVRDYDNSQCHRAGTCDGRSLTTSARLVCSWCRLRICVRRSQLLIRSSSFASFPSMESPRTSRCCP